MNRNRNVHTSKLNEKYLFLVKIMKNRNGSAAVFLALVFMAFSICIAGSIIVSRKLAVRSECESFGRLWARAVLSEYDIHLLEDYGIMAYFGNEAEVNKKIDAYISYSAAGKMDAYFKDTTSDLAGYELGDPGNFSTAMEKAFAFSAISDVFSGKKRNVRQNDDGEPRILKNPVVIDTLPSGGMTNSISNERLTERTRSIGDSDGVKSAAVSAGTETAFIWRYFGNNVTAADDKASFFRNEWEYIIKGSTSDEENLNSCRKRLFFIRNALNLAAIYKDPEKVELIVSVAETITPGPLGAATQLILAEAWAAAETEYDLNELYEGKRIPVLKSALEWHTGLGSILDDDSVKEKLDEETRTLLDEKREELGVPEGLNDTLAAVKEGLTYDEYLMLMIISMNRRTRLLRIMDLVQINMKIRHYRDFNLMEYFTGVRFTIREGKRNYYFEDKYR